jgi:tetratricopeptide (TPR) repeat protein
MLARAELPAGAVHVSSRRACLVAIAALVLAGARPAQAEDRAARAARAHFQRAEKAFSMGKFDEALKGYEDAYEAKPLPGLLFNIAQCHRNLTNPDLYIFFYQR